LIIEELLSFIPYAILSSSFGILLSSDNCTLSSHFQLSDDWCDAFDAGHLIAGATVVAGA
jgi:hypothetical protein